MSRIMHINFKNNIYPLITPRVFLSVLYHVHVRVVVVSVYCAGSATSTVEDAGLVICKCDNRTLVSLL